MKSDKEKDKKNEACEKNENIENKQKRRAPFLNKKGAAALISVLVIAAAVLINALFSLLPANFKAKDLTASKIYTVSEYTKKLIAQNEKEVVFYHIAPTGSEDVFIKELLSQYKQYGKNIEVKHIDAQKNPTAVSAFTTDTLSDNSVIVVCGDKQRILDNSEIYVTSTDYQTYQTTTSFDGEGQFTSAFNYVTSDYVPVVYTLTGHGEYSFGSEFSALIEKENILLMDLDLLTLGKVPQNADAVVINGGSRDISEEEANMLIEYLNAGGCVFLTTDYSAEEYPNLASVGAQFGLSLEDGVIIESNSNRYLSGYPMYIFPYMGEHETVKALDDGGSRCLLAVAQGLNITEKDGVTVNTLFKTSQNAYCRTNTENLTSLEKTSGDTEGEFVLGAAAEKNAGDKTAKLIWVTTSSVLDDSVDKMVSGANSDFVLNALNWFSGSEQKISIHSKSLYSDTLTISAGQTARWTAVLTVIVPLVVLIAGTMIFVARRKK